MYLTELHALEELLARWANYVEHSGDVPSAISVRDLIEKVATETRRVHALDRQYERLRLVKE